MSKPTDEQIKEFWEWCGFKVTWSDAYGSTGWNDPSGHYCFDLPPDIDPNNLFKYAVPKTITILIVANGIDEYEALEIIFARWLEKFREGYSMKDALFWVLWQVKEKSNE